MKTISNLNITMLGGFQIIYNDHILSDNINRSKMSWTLLEYLITFRKEDISQSNLLETLWPDASNSNPVGALKTLMHRVRKLLETLNYPEELIIQRKGSYAWNPEIPCTIDIDKFEELYEQSMILEANDPKKLETLLLAIDLYKGDFLPKTNSEAWVIPLHAYYHSLYLMLVHNALDIFHNQKLYLAAAELSGKALSIDPYDEKLYYHHIVSLYQSGNQAAAIKQYNYVTALFYDKFGVTPSNDLKSLYRTIIQTRKSLETDLDIIKEQLNESLHTGAFFCEYEIFKDIYQLELRTLDRSGDSVFIGLITLSFDLDNIPDTSIQTRIMKHLKDCICHSLRKGDVFARYSVLQYILLLPTISLENANLVLTRIKNNFLKENKAKNTHFLFSLRPITSK